MDSPWIAVGPVAGILAIDIIAFSELTVRASGWIDDLGVALVITGLLYATLRVLRTVWASLLATRTRAGR
jgi:hypothetical protein